MRERGEGRGEQLGVSQQRPRARWLGPLLSLASGAMLAAACANSSNSSEAGRELSQSEPGKPQQVVQRIAPAPAALAPAPPPAVAVNATAGSAAGPAASGGSGQKDPNERRAEARAAGADRVETVTAKHVEAELNRLEAELK
jgi:hypothetical protein